MLLAGYVMLNLFVKHKIGSFLEEQVSAGNLTYTDFTLKLWQGSISVDSLTYKFDSNTVSADKLAVYNISYLSYIVWNTINADQLIIENPNIKLVEHTQTDSIPKKDKNKLNFSKTVKINQFEFNHGNFLLVQDSLRKIQLHNYTLHFKDLKASEKSLKQKIPFLFEDILMQGGELYYQVNKDKYVDVDSINFDAYHALIYHLELKSNKTLSAYRKSPFNKENWVKMSLEKLQVYNYKFNLYAEQKKLTGSKIDLEGLCVSAYTDKRFSGDSVKVNTDSSSLSWFPLQIKVDTFNLKQIGFQYNELRHDDETESDKERSVIQLDDYNFHIYEASFGQGGEDPNFPLAYKDFAVKGNLFRYRLNTLQFIQLDSVDIKTHNALIYHPEIYSNLNRKQYANRKFNQNDWIQMNLETLKIYDYKLNLQAEKKELISGKIELNQFNSAIYSDIRSVKTKQKGKPDTATGRLDQLPLQIKIDTVSLNQGYFQYDQLTKNAKDLSMIRVENYNLHLYDLKIGGKDAVNAPLFNYKDFAVTGGKLRYHLNKLQDLEIDSMKIKTNEAVIHHIKLIPNYTRWTYVRVIPYEKDLMKMDLKTLRIQDYQFDLTNPDGKFTASKIILDTVEMNIFRDKRVTDDPVKKELYSGMLRHLKLDLGIDTLRVRNADLTYEELQEKTGKTGKVFFKNMNILATNLTNLNMQSSDFPKTKVAISSRFMGTSPLKVGWEFKINDLADHFRIYGSSYNIPPRAINSFLIPAFNIRTKGKGIEALYFNFSGNKNTANGDFKMIYDNLKIEVLKNDTGKKRGFLSFVGNLVMHKKRTKDKDAVQVSHVERDKTKSFWNYLWKCIFTGLSETLVF